MFLIHVLHKNIECQLKKNSVGRVSYCNLGIFTNNAYIYKLWCFVSYLYSFHGLFSPQLFKLFQLFTSELLFSESWRTRSLTSTMGFWNGLRGFHPIFIYLQLFYFLFRNDMPSICIDHRITWIVNYSGKNLFISIKFLNHVTCNEPQSSSQNNSLLFSFVTLSIYWGIVLFH